MFSAILFHVLLLISYVSFVLLAFFAKSSVLCLATSPNFVACPLPFVFVLHEQKSPLWLLFVQSPPPSRDVQSPRRPQGRQWGSTDSGSHSRAEPTARTNERAAERTAERCAKQAAQSTAPTTERAANQTTAHFGTNKANHTTKVAERTTERAAHVLVQRSALLHNRRAHHRSTQ